MDNKNAKILICCHKQADLPDNYFFFPIQVGSAISRIDLNMQKDDKLNNVMCDNISEKNKSYCELTALYWAWKNIKKIYPDLEVIGLCHYRRFFKNLRKFPNNNQVFVSKKNYFPYSIEIAYKSAHISDDFDTLRLVVHDLYPDYDEAFYHYMSKNNATYLFNMFVGPYVFMEEYCSWLFAILFEVEKRIDISNYSDVQKRIFGYMAERLLGVFLYKNKDKYKAVSKPIILTEENISFVDTLHYYINKARYCIAFFFGQGKRKRYF